MVQGTGSSVGKSTLVAGLCRLLARRGVRVAPFKAQNMSNNAAVCRDGGEIGRAQYAQAVAAGIDATVDMNPILLKPQPTGSQVVVRGHVGGVQTAAEYFRSRRSELWPVIVESLDRLRREYAVVLAEGAGSPAEINLRARDVVNMRVALHAGAEVLLVADIDRGGAFASLLGTWAWLEPEERSLLRGFVLNKFRGDATLLAPAPALLRERTGVPVLGVVPYVDDLVMPEEDAASLQQRASGQPRVEIAVVRLPHVANFDEFGPLASEAWVDVRYVTWPDELRAPDLVVLPGTKATIPDLGWLEERGLAARIRWLVAHDTPLLGICGGYQMLGRSVHDPLGIESARRSQPGLGMFAFETVLGPEKRLALASGTVARGLAGVWRALGGAEIEGYEIHMGRTPASAIPFLRVGSKGDGGVSEDGRVAGTYLHGVLERAEPRHRLIAALAARRGFTWSPAAGPRLDAYDLLADTLEASLRLDAIPSLAPYAPPGAAARRSLPNHVSCR
jgi:adenosylcobyric acid synthase